MESLAELIKEYWSFTLFLVGLLFHAIWTYFRVGELEKHMASFKEEVDFKIHEIYKERATLLSEITSLKEEIASINAKLDILVDGYRRK
jgi:septal ring factor EnvC (AmiA/AmiB activator)